MSALSHYRVLPSIASPGWMLLAIAARAPYAMIPLGTMTAITSATGSVSTGGLATGLTAAAGAVAAPLIGRWADHAGQRRVLSILVPASGLAVFLLLAAALRAWDGPLLWVICLAVGASTVPIGSFTRVRWSQLVRTPKELSTAFSYESTVDELTFVLGPAIVGFTAATAYPWAPLALAVLLILGAGLPFMLSLPANTVEVAPATVPSSFDSATGAGGELRAAESSAASAPAAGSTVAVMPSIPRVLWMVAPAMLVLMCIGTNFGAIQAAITERATVLGQEGSAGLAYALMGLGSAIMALCAVMIPDRVSLPMRAVIGGFGMALALVATAAVSSLPATAAVLFVVGIFVGPTLVTAFALAEKLAPAGGVGVAMTAMQSAITIGISVGAPLGGALVARHGVGVGVSVAIVAAVVIVTTGLSLQLFRAKKSHAEDTHAHRSISHA